MSTDPLAAVTAAEQAVAANESAETTAINNLIAYLQTVLAGAPPAGTVEVSTVELQSILTGLQSVQAAQTANTAAAVGAVPAPAPAAAPAAVQATAGVPATASSPAVPPSTPAAATVDEKGNIIHK